MNHNVLFSLLAFAQILQAISITIVNRRVTKLVENYRSWPYAEHKKI